MNPVVGLFNNCMKLAIKYCSFVSLNAWREDDDATEDTCTNEGLTPNVKKTYSHHRPSRITPAAISCGYCQHSSLRLKEDL
jgi:hypothetical protein